MGENLPHRFTDDKHLADTRIRAMCLGRGRQDSYTNSAPSLRDVRPLVGESSCKWRGGTRRLRKDDHYDHLRRLSFSQMFSKPSLGGGGAMAQGSTAHQKDSGLKQIETKRAEYAAYLESPEWIAVREAFFSNFARRCSSCGSFDRLQVHHTTYRHIYNELEHLDELVCLCSVCHRAEHGRHKLAQWRRVIRDVPCPHCGAPRGHPCPGRHKTHRSRTKLYRSPERYEWTRAPTTKATDVEKAAKALARWAKQDAAQ